MALTEVLDFLVKGYQDIYFLDVLVAPQYLLWNGILLAGIYNI
jgi:hypothetical protein